MEQVNGTTTMATTAATTRPVAVEDDNATLTNTTTEIPETHGGKELPVWQWIWPSVQEERPKTQSKIPPQVCNQYADEVRRLIRADDGFLKRLGIEEKINFGQQLSGGCRGFAQNYMQWPEDLIVGGVERQADQIIK